MSEFQGFVNSVGWYITVAILSLGLLAIFYETLWIKIWRKRTNINAKKLELNRTELMQRKAEDYQKIAVIEVKARKEKEKMKAEEEYKRLMGLKELQPGKKLSSDSTIEPMLDRVERNYQDRYDDILRAENQKKKQKRLEETNAQNQKSLEKAEKAGIISNTPQYKLKRPSDPIPPGALDRGIESSVLRNRKIKEQQDQEILESIKNDNSKKEEENRRKERQEALASRIIAHKKQHLPPAPTENDKNVTEILIRLPDGSRRTRKFKYDDTLSALYDFMDMEVFNPGICARTQIETTNVLRQLISGYEAIESFDLDNLKWESRSYCLRSSYPSKEVPDRKDQTFEEAGLVPQCTVFMEEN